jgi:predicted ATP-dependent endonuclease of OLD family
MSQKIIKLQAENVKRLKAVEITPNGNLVVIGGKNAQGKTSVLDSIAMALGGGRQIPDQPVRKGARNGSIILQTDNLIVTRKITGKKTSLEVRGANGEKKKSPQKILDELVGSISFDPLEFSRYEPKKQLEVLKRIAGVDLDALDQERDLAYEKRTKANQRAKELESRYNAAPYHEDVGAEEKSYADIVAQIEDRKKHNAENEEQRDRLAWMREKAVGLKREIADIELKLDVLMAEGKEQAEIVASLAEDEDWQPLQDSLAEIEADNRKRRENQEYQKLGLEFESAAKATEALTIQIKEIDRQREEAVASTKMPLEGLGLGKDGVMFGGLPFDQSSSAEQLRISVAIGLALNPELKVLLVRDGSLLDENNLRMIAEMAAEADAQVWIERVGEGDECSVILEDGEIK